MIGTLKIVGWAMLAASVALAAQHLFSQFEGDLAGPIWSVLDVVMAIALTVAIAVSVRRFIRSRDSGDIVEKVFANFLPLLVTVTSVMFVESYFTTELFAADDYQITPERIALWEAIDILFVLVAGWIGVHLVKHASDELSGSPAKPNTSSQGTS